MTDTGEITHLIPAELLIKWRTRSYRASMMKLASLLDLRPIIEDAKAEGKRTIMQMYVEAADAMMVHPDTVRADLAIIRSYPPDKLAYWIKNGVGFSHIEMANSLQEVAKKPAMQILDECITLGNSEGCPMTVNELIVFALGEKKKEPAFFRVNALFSRLDKLPFLLGWEQEKIVKFNVWLDYGRSEFL